MPRPMKDSGVSWIGDVPSHWGITRNKALLSWRSEKGYPDETVLSLYREYGVIPKDSRDDNHNVTSEDTSSYKFVRKGDFVVNKMKAWQGSMGLSEYQGIISPAYHVYEYISNAVEPRYHHHLLRTAPYAGEFRRLSTGMRPGQWDLSKEDFLCAPVLVPPKEEQLAISNYVDAKCVEIDAAIEAAEASIEEYKSYRKSLIFGVVTKGLNHDVPMKDSGIDAVGVIPESWRVVPGKFILNCLSRPITAEDEIITCFRDGEVTLRKNRREDGFTVAEKEIGYQGIEPGDLVVHGMDGFAGAIGISDSRGKASPVLNVLSSEEYKPFLMYYMRALAYRDVYMALSTGIRVRSCNLSWKKIGDLRFVLPNKEEQIAIADFLNNKCDEIQQIIDSKLAIVEELKAYKKSLIYEIVTGKKEVI